MTELMLPLESNTGVLIGAQYRSSNSSLESCERVFHFWIGIVSATPVSSTAFTEAIKLRGWTMTVPSALSAKAVMRSFPTTFSLDVRVIVR
jgi:hypothetical protein